MRLDTFLEQRKALSTIAERNQLKHKRRKLERRHGMIDAAEKENQKLAVKECTSILEQFPILEIPIEDLARLAAKQNNPVTIYLDNKFKLEESRKVQLIRDELLKNPSIEKVRDRPITFRWKRRLGEEERGKQKEELAEEKAREGGNVVDATRKIEEDDRKEGVEQSSSGLLTTDKSVLQNEPNNFGKLHQNFHQKDDCNCSENDFEMQSYPVRCQRLT